MWWPKGAHEKRWGDREAEDEGWRGAEREESIQPAGRQPWEEKGALWWVWTLTQNIEKRREGEQGGCQ